MIDRLTGSDAVRHHLDADLPVDENPFHLVTAFGRRLHATGRTVCLSDDALAALGQWFYCRNPEIALVFYGRGRQSIVFP